MTDLLTRLRDATEGSRELDLVVNELAGGAPMSTIKETMIGQWLPHYTTSIDAALTLVPEEFTSVQLFSKPEGCKARLKRRRDALLIAPMEGERPDRLVATPALALCIAALQAQQSKAEVA